MKKELTLTSESELYRQIRAGDIRPCYLFYGKDVATLESVVKRLISKLVPDDARDFNYHFFPGGEFDLSEFADALGSLPVYSDRLVAAVNDLNAESLKASDTKFLNTVISEIDGSTATAIFYATGVDLCGGKKKLSPKNLALAEKIAAAGGEVVEFAYKQPQELVKYIRSRVEKGGSSIGYDAALSLAEACLCNLLMINNEIEKLTAFRPGETISDSDVSLLVAGQLDTDVYKLARAVAQGDRGAAFTILPELYNRGLESLAILNVLGSSFVDLYRAKLAVLSGRTRDDVAAGFDYKNRAFVIRDAIRDCSRIPVERLRSCVAIAADCDIDMKSKPTDKRVLLEEAITKMLGV